MGRIQKKKVFYDVNHHAPIGQLSYTCLAMSAAESFGENRNSFVFPLTKMSLKLIWNTNNRAIRSSVSIHPTLPQHRHETAFSARFNSVVLPWRISEFHTRIGLQLNHSLLKQCVNSYYTTGKLCRHKRERSAHFYRILKNCQSQSFAISWSLHIHL